MVGVVGAVAPAEEVVVVAAVAAVVVVVVVVVVAAVVAEAVGVAEAVVVWREVLLVPPEWLLRQLLVLDSTGGQRITVVGGRRPSPSNPNPRSQWLAEEGEVPPC